MIGHGGIGIQEDWLMTGAVRDGHGIQLFENPVMFGLLGGMMWTNGSYGILVLVCRCLYSGQVQIA